MASPERWSLAEQVLLDLGRVVLGTAFRLRIEGTRHLPRSGGAVIVCNHPTMLEPLLLTLALPRPCLHLALPTPWKYPATAYLMDLFGCLKLEPGRNTLAVLRGALAALASGRLVVVFPEGELSDTGALQPFQLGAAMLALRAGCPVVPAAVRGTYEALPRGRIAPRPRPTTVRFGPPLSLAPARGRRHDPRLLRLLAEEMRGAVCRLVTCTGSRP